MTDVTRDKLYIRDLMRVIAASLEYRAGSGNYGRDGRACDGFVFVLSGECEYCFRNGKSFTAVPGDILYLAAGARYSMHLLPGIYSYIFCDFDFDGTAERGSRRVASLHPGETEATFRRLLRAYRQDGFAECMSLLYKIYGDLRDAANAAYVGKGARDRIEACRLRIERDYPDPALSVRALAEEAGMSEVYFRKLFRELYGDPPSEYLAFTRLKAAQELMQFSPLPLGECAEKCGFSSVQYFCRVFKKKRGISPSRWRKENREQAT